MNLATTLTLLLQGRYLCPVTHPREWEQLADAAAAERADRWLAEIGMRLARLGDDGAFFMARRSITADDRRALREELLRFRDEHATAVESLNLIRQALDEPPLRPGESVSLGALMTAIGERATLEARLRRMHGALDRARHDMNNRAILQRLLGQLEREGYLLLVSAKSETWRVTGKIEQLLVALQYIAEHAELGEDPAEDGAAPDAQADWIGPDGPAAPPARA